MRSIMRSVLAIALVLLALILVISVPALAQATYASGMRIGTGGLQVRGGPVTIQDAAGTTTAFINPATGALTAKTGYLYNTDATETLTVAQSGSTIVCTAAGDATTITLPAADATTVGAIYYILQTANQNVDITTAVANNNSFVADNVATSDKVSLATAQHLIGAGAVVIGIQTGAATYKWYVGALSPTCPLTVEAAD